MGVLDVQLLLCVRIHSLNNQHSRRGSLADNFCNLGVLINCNISTYMTGSSLIPLGLSWWQAIIAIVVGNILASMFIVLNSLPGAFYHCKSMNGTPVTLIYGPTVLTMTIQWASQSRIDMSGVCGDHNGLFGTEFSFQLVSHPKPSLTFRCQC